MIFSVTTEDALSKKHFPAIYMVFVQRQGTAIVIWSPVYNFIIELKYLLTDFNTDWNYCLRF